MKKKLFLFTLNLFIIGTASLYGQVVIYSEDFDGGMTWSINTDTGVEGANPNTWYISCEEEGVGVGVCGATCGAGNNTLHVSTDPGLGDLGAAYLETGTGLTNSDRRSESGDISTIGDVDLTLTFDMIGMGNATDFTELFYSIDGGASWVSLDGPLTELCCGSVVCTGAEQGLWANRSYALPVACEGIANLRISFVWKNADDGVATDPSFAVDNIRIEKPDVSDDLNASYNPSSTVICEGDCITFVEASTGTGIIGYAWTFSDPEIAGPILTADPGTVCFPNTGDIEVTLTITDGAATDDTTITIKVNPNPVITATASETTICVGGAITLTGTGDADVYTWDGGVIDGVEFTLDETTTFTLTGTNNFDCSVIEEITITVIPCDPLIAGFTYDDIVCIGDCRTFTDTSSGEPVNWLWDFSGAADLSIEQNPTICFTTAGIFDVQLTVTNGIGESSSTTNSITVFDVPTIAAAYDTIIDLGGLAQLIATGSIPDGDFVWAPDDFVECETCPITSASPPQDMVYIVTLVDVNGCSASDTVRVLVNFIEAIGVPDAFTPNEDGANDVLFVRGFGLETISFKIYNKYGEKVFESRTQNIGWDGTFRNKKENPGVFTWVLEYQFINGKSGLLKGTTTLVR